jgi:pyruvate-formate lyase
MRWLLCYGKKGLKCTAIRLLPHTHPSPFTQPPTLPFQTLWGKLEKLIHEECEKGVMDVDPSVPSTITAFPPGYIDKDAELIVGLQARGAAERETVHSLAATSFECMLVAAAAGSFLPCCCTLERTLMT